jgi:hypothetical protein
MENRNTLIYAWTKRVKRRARNLGLSYRQSTKLASLFQRQLSAQGFVGGVAYLKKLRDSVNYALYKTPSKPGWVKFKGGFPARVSFLKGVAPETLHRALACFNVVELERFTLAQVHKRVGSVVEPVADISIGLGNVCATIGRVVRRYQIPQRSVKVDLLLKERETNKRTGEVNHRTEDKLSAYRSYPFLLADPRLIDIIYPCRLEDFFNAVESASKVDTVGVVRIAQEPGCKARLYAYPNPAFQVHLATLHKQVCLIRDNLGTDCTNDQSRGAIWAQEIIDSGRPVYSVDLSAATDRFPLSVQLHVLRNIGVEPYLVELFRQVSTGDWELTTPTHIEEDAKEYMDTFEGRIRWAVGQPLGTKPSMSVFSLTHNLLLEGLCDELGLKCIDSFRVLGDDVVIANRELKDAYVGAVTSLGVTVSHDKCREGSFAEFAGYQIGRSFHIRPTKWRIACLGNAFELANELGSYLKGEVSHAMREALKLFLFSTGKFNPPVKQWPFYIRGCNLLFERSIHPLFEQFITVVNGRRTFVKEPTSYYDGACDYLLESKIATSGFQARKEVQLQAIGPVVEVAKRLLREHPQMQFVVEQAAMTFDMYAEEGFYSSAVIWYLYTWMTRAYEFQLLTMDDLYSLYKSTVAALYSTLWCDGNKYVSRTRFAYLYQKGLLDVLSLVKE